MADDIKRLNYFTGQFLEAQDFLDEQSYHIDMRRRLNASLRGSGILDGGFKVDIKSQSTETAPAIITVGAGFGVDNQGQELVILSKLEKEIPLNDLNSNKNKTIAVYLGYQQLETDSKTSTDASGITRWTERPKITLQSSADSAPADMIRLENIIVDQNGQISITDKITLDKPGGVSITDKPVRQLASLWVDGNVGIGTKNPASKLEVSGTLKVSGNGHIEVPGQTNENDAAIILGRSSGDPGSVFIVPKLGTGGYNSLSQEGDFGLFWRANSKQDAGNLVIGPWNDTTAGIKITASGNVGIGTATPQLQLHVEGGSEMHSGGNGAGVSFSDRDKGFVTSPTAGERWVWFAQGGTARLWSGSDKLSITADGNVGVNGDIAIDGKHALRGSDSWLRLNQDFAFSSGVHTPGLFAPVSLNVGGVGGWANPGNGNATIAGDIAIGGKHALRGSDSWLRLNQDFAFSSGVHTPGLFAPESLNVGGVGGWNNPGNGNATFAGDVSIGGKVGIGTATPEQMLSVLSGLNVDHAHANGGTLQPGITFGNTSGEGISSNRSGGGVNPYGLDFYAGGLVRLSINNAGNVGVNGDIAIDGKHAFRGSDPWLRLNQDNAFSSGVHTPGLFAPMSLNVGGVGGWGNPGNGNATIAGDIAIGGKLSNLNVAEADGFAYVGCHDFLIGHSTRRGTPGRALVDSSNTLILNYGPDWANVSIGGTVKTPSSRQLKENIQTLPSQLAKQIISTLEPVSFTYKHDSLKSQCLGFIAEDAPTEVASSNYDAIIMNHIVTALTRVVKDQEQTIAELAVQVNLLRNKNA